MEPLVLTVGTINVRSLEVGENSVSSTADEIIDMFQAHSLDILLLQDVNLSLQQDHLVRELQAHLERERITFEPNRKNTSQQNGDCAIAFWDPTCIKYKKKVKFSPDGRSIALLLQFGRTRVCVVSIYMPPNPHAKQVRVASRVLHNAWRLGWSAQAVVLAGDYNAHVQESDARQLRNNASDWNYNHARPFGALRDFIIDHELTDGHIHLGVGGYTHRHRSSGCETESLKDRFLFSNNVRCHRLYTESFERRLDFSDHVLVVAKFSFEDCSAISDYAEDEMEFVEPRFRCGMRKYSPNKKEYLVLYTFATEGYDWKQYIKEELESYEMDLRSCTITRVNRTKLRIGWTSGPPAWESAAIYLASDFLKANYKLGPCYMKVEQIQANMHEPENLNSLSLDDRICWIHKALRESMEAVCPRRQQSRSKKKETTIDIKRQELRDCNQMIRLLQNVTRFSTKSPVYRRSLGHIRKRLGKRYIRRQAVFHRYLRYYEDRRKQLKSHVKSVKYRKLKRTKSALANMGLRSKRVFDDVLGRQPSCRTLLPVEQDEIDYGTQEFKLLKLFQNWVPPLEAKDQLKESPPGDSAVQLKNLREWLEARGVEVNERILQELEPRPYIETSMWSNLLKPITDADIRSACRNKKSAPGRSRVTHRMVLYASSNIQAAIAALLTDVLSTGNVPDAFKVALLRPIPKELGKPIEEAARPIVLLECIWKILTAILSSRLQQTINEQQLVFPAAFGFLHGKRIQDALHIKMALEQLGRESTRPRYSLELDVSKAYDHTRGHMLDICCSRFKLPTAFCRLVQNMRSGATNLLTHEGRILGSIAYDTLRQGCPLSCCLYVLSMDPLLFSLDKLLAGVSIESSKGLSRLTGVAYADDVTTYHDSVDDVQASLSICDQFFSLNMQKINPTKSILRATSGEAVSVTFRGHQLTTVTGSQASRYLGLHYAPDGTVQELRRKIKEILQRLNQALRAKTCSAQLRGMIINSVVIPKLLYICSSSCWRIHDLEWMRNNLKRLFDFRLSDKVLYGSTRTGGAGLVDIAQQGAEQFIFHFFRAVTDTRATKTGTRLLNHARRESPTVVEFRQRQLEINSWRNSLFYALLERAQKSLRTTANPLGLPVHIFLNAKEASMDLITTCRNYCTFLNLQVVDLVLEEASNPDIYHVFPPQEAEKIVLNLNPTPWMKKMLQYSANSIRLGTNLCDGWKVKWLNKDLRQGNRFVNNLLKLPMGTKVDTWRHCSLPLTRLPCLNQIRFGDVVAYQVLTVLLNDKAVNWPQLGVVLEADSNSESIILTPLLYQFTFDANKELVGLSARTDQWDVHRVRVDRAEAISYGNVTSTQFGNSYSVVLNIPSWNRDKVLLLNSWILRKIHTDRQCVERARLRFLNVTQRESERLQSPFSVFTDGSCTNDGDSFLIGAGAVIRTHNQGLRRFYTFIPCMTGTLWPTIPSSLYAEIAGAALGGWVMMTQFQRSCHLTTDNQSLKSILNNSRKWPDLHKQGGFYGSLLQVLLETGVIQNTSWIRAHQTDMTISGVWENSEADKLAELSRRQGITTNANLVQLPFWYEYPYTIAPIQPGMEIKLPTDRNSGLALTTYPLPSSEWLIHGAAPLRSLHHTLRYHDENGKPASKLPEDSEEKPFVRLTALRVRSGMAPLGWEVILARPDIYGLSPICPCCQIGIFRPRERIDVWKHILFHCSHPEVRRIVDIQKHLIDHQYLLIHHQRLRKLLPKDKALLQVLLHANDNMKKKRTCANCGTYQIVRQDGTTRNVGFLVLERHGLLAEWTTRSYDAAFGANSVSCSLCINPHFYIYCREILRNAERYICGGHAGCVPPDATRYQFWIRPCTQESAQNPELERTDLTDSGWECVVSWHHPATWWSPAILCGSECHHAPSAPIAPAAMLLVSHHTESPPQRLRLADLRPLWKHLVLESQEEENGMLYISSFGNSELPTWIGGVPGLAQVHSTCSTSRTAILMPWSHPSPNTEAEALHWWMENKSEIRYGGILGSIIALPYKITRCGCMTS